MNNKRLILLDPKGLNDSEAQLAIDLYISEMGESKRNTSRLNSLVDELLNENKALKKTTIGINITVLEIIQGR